MFMNQAVVYTIRLNVPLHMYIENEVTGFPYMPLQVLLVLCGIWSLDFFRPVIPPFCVSSNIKAVHVVTLEYVVALYPIFLNLITFVCIKPHDNSCLAMEAISQTLCSLEEEMGLHSIFHTIAHLPL